MFKHRKLTMILGFILCSSFGFAENQNEDIIQMIFELKTMSTQAQRVLEEKKAEFKALESERTRSENLYIQDNLLTLEYILQGVNKFTQMKKDHPEYKHMPQVLAKGLRDLQIRQPLDISDLLRNKERSDTISPSVQKTLLELYSLQMKMITRTQNKLAKIMPHIDLRTSSMKDIMAGIAPSLSSEEPKNRDYKPSYLKVMHILNGPGGKPSHSLLLEAPATGPFEYTRITGRRVDLEADRVSIELPFRRDPNSGEIVVQPNAIRVWVASPKDSESRGGVMIHGSIYQDGKHTDFEFFKEGRIAENTFLEWKNPTNDLRKSIHYANGVLTMTDFVTSYRYHSTTGDFSQPRMTFETMTIMKMEVDPEFKLIGAVKFESSETSFGMNHDFVETKTKAKVESVEPPRITFQTYFPN